MTHILCKIGGKNECAAEAAEARIRELEQERDREAGRWQKEIYDLIRKHVPRPDDIDGGGCDSGDPLDLTLDEIGQGFAQLKSDGNPLSPYCGSGEMGIECEKSQLQAQLQAVTQERDRELASRNTAYSERDQLVCALSKLFPAHIERHPDEDISWENDWRWIIFIQFPTGQGSWHIHDSELAWFDHLTRTDGNTWDGHTTAEKYARIARLEVIQS